MSSYVRQRNHISNGNTGKLCYVSGMAHRRTWIEYIILMSCVIQSRAVDINNLYSCFEVVSGKKGIERHAESKTIYASLETCMETCLNVTMRTDNVTCWAFNYFFNGCTILLLKNSTYYYDPANQGDSIQKLFLRKKKEQCPMETSTQATTNINPFIHPKISSPSYKDTTTLMSSANDPELSTGPSTTDAIQDSFSKEVSTINELWTLATDTTSPSTTRTPNGDSSGDKTTVSSDKITLKLYEAATVTPLQPALCICACSLYEKRSVRKTCANLTIENQNALLQAQINEIQKDMHIPKQNMSSFSRKKTCAGDDRWSAHIVGFIFGVTVLMLVAFTMFISDFSIIVEDIRDAILTIIDCFRRTLGTF